MANFDITLLDQTIKVWQPHYQEPLTREDARQILENTVVFFRTLMVWKFGSQSNDEITGEAC